MGDTVPKVEGLNCPKCGAPLTMRTFGQAVTVVCPNCHSILDAKDPKLEVLQTFESKQRIKPQIPLGRRGKLRGEAYEVIGFQVRTVRIEGVQYHWREYVLFNPYKGFRYLTEYDGHWNYVKTVQALPETAAGGARGYARLLGKRYNHFQTCTAETSFVLGEFPWQVRVGEKAEVRDYVAPPEMLSAETTGNETTWSLGEYMPGAQIWEAFQLDGAAPPASGVYANQPRPSYGVRGMWRAFLMLALTLIVVSLGIDVVSGKHVVFDRRYTFGAQGAFVTDEFELKGRPGTVEVRTTTQRNVEAFFNYALIGTSGRAWNFGRELEEGRDTAILAAIPPGRYYLRVEPEGGSGGVDYEIRVRLDVPVLAFYIIAAILLAIPPVLLTFRSWSFESRRWKESDYAS